MFLDSEFFSTELSVLAYFTLKVRLPFLHCVEISAQAQLCRFLPKLYKDLKEKNMDTLQQLFVPCCHVELQQPLTNTELKLLNLMCVDVAYVLMQQCGREYRFAMGDL